MKKSVVILVLLLVPLVSAQVLNLPVPPSVPESDDAPSDVPESVEDDVAEAPVPELRRDDPLILLESRVIELESRLSTLESQISGLAGLSSRIDGFQNQVNTLRAEVEQRPSVENPVSTDDFTETTDELEGRLKWSMIVAVLALLGVLGVIGSNVFKRISANEQTKKEIKGYVSTYLSQGYSLDSIQAQLKTAGWDSKLTDAVVSGLKKGGAK